MRISDYTINPNVRIRLTVFLSRKESRSQNYDTSEFVLKISVYIALDPSHNPTSPLGLGGLTNLICFQPLFPFRGGVYPSPYPAVGKSLQLQPLDFYLIQFCRTWRIIFPVPPARLNIINLGGGLDHHGLCFRWAAGHRGLEMDSHCFPLISIVGFLNLGRLELSWVFFGGSWRTWGSLGVSGGAFGEF